MICTTFTERYNDFWEHNPRWEAVLDDDTKVYQDDYLNHSKSSWERLGEYCKKNNRRIKYFRCGFRDNVITLPENKSGYFFKRMVRGYFGGTTRNFFLVGYVQDGIIIINKYSVPEFILDEETTRELDLEDPSLILFD